MNLPTAIDRYQIRERLGQGGMGTLFLALDPAIDRLVALKVLRVDNPEVRERFEREARLAARLQHPNIVTVYDVGEHEGQPFIAMEYIPGETLAELIRRRAPLDLRRKLELMIEVCNGLAFAHRHGIVHRDIKPANLMVSRDSSLLKILDFGIARAGESGLTQVGMVIGTPNYMSPEQVRGETVDHRSDIFAVGLVLYELLTYRQAFEADTAPAVLMKILTSEPPPLGPIDPVLDPALASIVGRALAKDPGARYQDLGALRSELVRLAQRLDVEPDEGRTVIVPPPRGTGPMPPRGSTGQTPVDDRRTARFARYIAAADAALAQGDPAAARSQLELAEQVEPDNPKLPELRQRVAAAQDAHDLAKAIGDARMRIAAGELTEAARLLQEAQRIDPHAPELAATRAALERALAAQEAERERHRRASVAFAQAREALVAGALDTAQRAINEVLGLFPGHPEALALRAEIQAAAGNATRPHTRQRTSVIPPPIPQPAGAAAPAAPPPPTAAVDAPQPLVQATGVTASRRLPRAFLAVAALVLLVVALTGLLLWRQFAGTPAPTVAQKDARPVEEEATQSAVSALHPEEARDVANGSTGPSADGASPGPSAPTTATAGDAALRARLEEAVTAFREDRVPAALDTLGALIEEAPERDDLRQTADQWARTLRQRAAEARRSARRSTRLTPAMREADARARTGQEQLARGDALAAARAFEQARATWSAVTERRTERSTVPRPAAGAPGTNRNARLPEPTPAQPASDTLAPPAPSAARSATSAAQLASPAPPDANALEASSTAEEFERAAVLRVLQSFERAFDSRSADSLKPIWPSLPAGVQQAYQARFSGLLHQQWTYDDVDIRVTGRRAVADCRVTLTTQAQGSRETNTERRSVRISLERMGPIWVIAGVSGV
ncbi:MAG TPA: serine/threonine-protein kinase [Vicinamibacterales bacterium]